MIETLPRTWLGRRGFILNEVTRLVSQVTGEVLPVPLRPIALERQVKAVVFRPLLMDGCLGLCSNGFVIFVACSHDRVKDLNRRFNEERAGYTLPARVRFTVAHEIAHTFFFDLSQCPPASRVKTLRSETISKLESTCNIAASYLLLPQAVMDKTVTNVDFLCPESLRSFVDEAGVSPEMLIYRLGRKALRETGAIAYLRPQQGQFIISAITKASFLNGMFTGCTKGVLSEMLISDARFVLNGGTLSSLTLDVPCHVGSVATRMPCNFSVERSDVESYNRGCFLTIQAEGGPIALNAAGEMTI